MKHPPRSTTQGPPCVLTINGGSSSIRSAVYELGETPWRRLAGKIDRIGLRGTNLTVNAPAGVTRPLRRTDGSDHRPAAAFLPDWPRLLEHRRYINDHGQDRRAGGRE